MVAYEVLEHTACDSQALAAAVTCFYDTILLLAMQEVKQMQALRQTCE